MRLTRSGYEQKTEKETCTGIQGEGSVGRAERREQTLVELSQCYQIHPNQIAEWKKQLLEHAPDIFSKDRKPEQVPSVKDLHAKIGQLSMENDFLSGALSRIGDASTRR